MRPTTPAPAQAVTLAGYGTGPVTCPCGEVFTGRWADPEASSPQACPACGHVVTVSWPGWAAAQSS